MPAGSNKNGRCRRRISRHAKSTGRAGVAPPENSPAIVGLTERIMVYPGQGTGKILAGSLEDVFLTRLAYEHHIN
jgi:hypothetical protein